MIRIKIFAVVCVLSLVGIVFYGSRQFSVSANDGSEEIANYKTWTRVSKEPIKIEIDNAALAGG